MKETSLKLPKPVTPQMIEDACKAVGLQITFCTTLRSIAPNSHWHVKKAKEKGVLEITLLHNTGEVILSYKDNRFAPWITDAIKDLSGKI